MKNLITLTVASTVLDLRVTRVGIVVVVVVILWPNREPYKRLRGLIHEVRAGR